ncbi:MFS transporter [Galactobacter caseinivorans]|uniref:MFS transporter n=1 Tax=Galactobacter caseinivorans TaxID=2676123 RepID=A0A496PJ16_9MICC|nr:MFS transporter [Galactobacter caseinivorans]RKW70502.1 MFS transporter [Galactobacter caseinivorans]
MSLGGSESGASPWSGHERGSRGYRAMILALFAAGVATFSQLYSVQGVLPELAADQRISEADAALAVSMATLGLAVSVIPWSVMADRRGRRTTMRLAILCAVVLGLLVPFAPTFQVLLGLRLLEGLALGGIPAVALAYLTEEVAPLAAAVASGTYISGTTLGGLLGRLVAGPLSEFYTWRVGTFVVSAVAAVAGLIFFLVAPAPRGFQPVVRRSARDIPLLRKLVTCLKDRRLVALFCQGGLLMGGFVAVYNYLGFRLQAPPFLIPASLSALLFLAYLSGTWSSAQSGRLSSRHGRYPVLRGASGVMLAGLLLTWMDSLPAVIAGLLLFTAGFFAAHATASGWVPGLVRTGRAQASSLYNLAYYGGSSLFGWAVGLAFQGQGWGGVVASVGAMIVLAVLIAWAVLRKEGRGAALGS